MKLFVSVVVCAAVISAVSGDVVYRNDFSTRTSAGAIPSQEWREMSYHTGTLLRNHNKNWSGPFTPYALPASIQDGWACPNFGVGNNIYVMTGAKVFTNSVDQIPEGDCTNQFFMNDGAVYPRSCVALHPIENEFTNGIVRISADIRAPDVWLANSYARVMPIYKSQMNDLDWGSSEFGYETPVAFGPQYQYVVNAFKSYPVLLHGNGDETSETVHKIDSTGMARNWYRFVAEINLDTELASCSVYDLGPGNPVPETEGTFVASVTDKKFFRPMTSARGGITGIGIVTYRVFSESGVVTNSLCVDNLSVAWKAPDASVFSSCYENDFTTRRVRSICPAATAECTYASTQESVVDEFSEYTEREKIIPNADASLRDIKPQPIGIDNWRRINDDGTGMAAVDNLNDGIYGRVLRLTTGNIFVCVTQPLGEDISSGKVRISADMRLPDKWYWTLARSAALTMGTTEFSRALYRDFSKNKIGNVGVTGSSVNEFLPFYADTSTHKNTSTNCLPLNWYRIVQTADLYEQKYDYALYHLVDGEIAGEPVYSVTGVSFANEVRSIGSFALYAYAAGTTLDTAVLFDNIKVWKNVGESDETLVYSNDFLTRRRYVSAGRVHPAPIIDRTDSGIDGWTRRECGLADVYVQSSENPALTMKGYQDYAYVLHPFGKTFSGGKILDFSIDIRPPTLWSWSTRREALVTLGDDVFLQGNINESAPFTSGFGAGFGFVNTNESTTAGIFYEGAVPCVYSGDGCIYGAEVDPSHWYRFRVRFVPGNPTYTLNIYDMGTEHPDAASENGTLLQRFENVPIWSGCFGDAVSGYALAAFGAPGFSAWDGDNPDAVLFDNVCASMTYPGMFLSIR